LCNFIPDWNSLAYEVNLPNYEKYKTLASLLHFNNLVTGKLVRDYWVQFLTNQHKTVQAILDGTLKQKTESGSNAALEPLDKQFLLLCSMGYSLHAVQDFYTHSNFINTLKRPQNTTTETCYYTANTYQFDSIDDTDYNLHTYYYPEKYKDEVQREYPDGDMVVHGEYDTGINKDSYARADWQQAYASAFMGTVDTIDTWRGWINNDTIWNGMLNYEFNTPAMEESLGYGLLSAFRISNYIRIPWNEDAADGHWKGPGSGNLIDSGDELLSFVRNDWQSNSPFQRGWYDTEISALLTLNLGRPAKYTPADSLVMFPNPDATTIANFDAKKLGVVNNDASEFKAVIVRTWGAGEWKSTPGADADQEIDGLYAIIGIDGQEFREATQYQEWTHPFWTAMRFIKSDQKQVQITYDLMIYASDLSSVFSNDEDIEAVIKPPTDRNAPGAQQALEPEDGGQHLIRPAAVKKSMQTLSMIPMTDELHAKMMSRASSLRNKLASTRHRMTTKQAGANVDPYTYRDIINPNKLDREQKGVVFMFNTETQQVASGLPDYYLGRTYLDINNTLRLQGAQGNINIAQVNVSVEIHTMCDADARQEAGTGVVPVAVVAAPTADGWGARPDSGASFGTSISIVSLAVTLLLSLFSWA
jgi:hypothetical protein